MSSVAVDPESNRFLLHSPAFADGGVIPALHTADGLNLSPPLRWQGAPAGTQSLVLVLDDPDAPGGPWVHWLVYAIPPALHALPAGLERHGSLPNGVRQGLCWGTRRFTRLGYQGPQPPPGPAHHYHFRLFALDRILPLPAGCAWPEVRQEMEGHVLADVGLTGLYATH